MSLIAMCVYDTEKNNRTPLTKRTIDSLFKTVNTDNHRIFIVNQNSCDATLKVLDDAKSYLKFTQIDLPENIGTANGINSAWKNRRDGEHLIKMDNDVIIHQCGWVDLLEEAISRKSDIGIIGLKRKDLLESTLSPHPLWHSELLELPHKPGERNMYIELVHHVMGTCQMYNYALIDVIGGLYQLGGLYGFDDSLAAIRTKVAGFYNCFMPYIEIDHIDPGGNDHQVWKENYALQRMDEYNRVKESYINGTMSIYHPI